MSQEEKMKRMNIVVNGIREQKDSDTAMVMATGMVMAMVTGMATGMDIHRDQVIIPRMTS